MRDVQFTLVLSVGLVVLVVLMFLRTIRATIIAGVALPLSLVATFGVMWFCGFSLNNLSLMALTIGTGFIVDDVIVMIENIVRHIERGLKPIDAALEGAREIGFTVISLTLSLIAVFIPLLFMTGLVGRMFREFALTLTIAVVISAIVSLTLTPMMCSRMLRHQGDEKPGLVARGFNRLIDWVIGGYHRSLEWVLRHERATLLTTFATLVITIGLYRHRPEGLSAAAGHRARQCRDGGRAEVSFAEMQRLQATVAKALRTDTDVEGVVTVIGVSSINPTPNAGHLKITLKPRDARRPTVGQIVERLQASVAGIPGVTAVFPAGAGHPDQHARQPRPVPVHAGRQRRQRGRHLVDQAGREAAQRAGAARGHLRGSRRAACAPWSTSTARRQAGSASRCRPSTTRSTMRSASGRSRPSTRSPTSIASCWRPCRRYQGDASALTKLYVPAQRRRAGAVRAPSAKIERRTAPLAINHQDQFPSVTDQLQPGARRVAERCGACDLRRQRATSACRPR